MKSRIIGLTIFITIILGLTACTTERDAVNLTAQESKTNEEVTTNIEVKLEEPVEEESEEEIEITIPATDEEGNEVYSFIRNGVCLTVKGVQFENSETSEEFSKQELEGTSYKFTSDFIKGDTFNFRIGKVSANEEDLSHFDLPILQQQYTSLFEGLDLVESINYTNNLFEMWTITRYNKTDSFGRVYEMFVANTVDKDTNKGYYIIVNIESEAIDYLEFRDSFWLVAENSKGTNKNSTDETEGTNEESEEGTISFSALDIGFTFRNNYMQYIWQLPLSSEYVPITLADGCKYDAVIYLNEDKEANTLLVVAKINNKDESYADEINIDNLFANGLVGATQEGYDSESQFIDDSGNTWYTEYARGKSELGIMQIYLAKMYRDGHIYIASILSNSDHLDERVTLNDLDSMVRYTGLSDATLSDYRMMITYSGGLMQLGIPSGDTEPLTCLANGSLEDGRHVTIYGSIPTIENKDKVGIGETDILYFLRLKNETGVSAKDLSTQLRDSLAENLNGTENKIKTDSVIDTDGRYWNISEVEAVSEEDGGLVYTAVHLADNLAYITLYIHNYSIEGTEPLLSYNEFKYGVKMGANDQAYINKEKQEPLLSGEYIDSILDALTIQGGESTTQEIEPFEGEAEQNSIED